jgi:hypothetical protein
MSASIPILDESADRTHAPAEDRAFSEAALFVWHDLASGAGGFLRLSQEPVVQALNACFGVFTGDGRRFRANVTGAQMTAADRGEAFMSWGSQLRVELDTLTITADFPDCQASIRFRDFFPRYDWFALLGRPPAPSHHFEAAGSMTGRVAIGGHETEIDGLGYRDRSWGPRRSGGRRSTRWWPAVFGPDLCVFLNTALLEPEYYGAHGYLIRDGVPQPLSDVDIGVMLESDAISPRSGVGRFTLPGGETGELTHQPRDGVVLHVRGFTAVESIGTARWGDRIGMSNLEVGTNPAGGERPPQQSFGANNGEGLSRR